MPGSRRVRRLWSDPGERESYLQWREDSIPLTVVFEILSPSNTHDEMQEKQEFYEHHGVEEYYEYNPQTNRLFGFRRQGEAWVRIRDFDSWVSPRLGVRFRLTQETLLIETADGQPFLAYEEVAERLRDERLRADNEKTRADNEKTRADNVEQSARRMTELGRKARHGQVTAEEMVELERLELQFASSPG